MKSDFGKATSMTFVIVLLLLLCLAPPTLAQEGPPVEPKIADASDEAETAIAQFQYPENLKATLFAAEPDIANPVAFHVDFMGRVFVCETFRQEHGVEDNRRHGHWLDEELAAQTVADRIKYMKRQYPDDWRSKFESQDDRIRVLTDNDNDGVADSSKVFSDKYNGIAMGTGAGVLSYRGDVFYTCIPDLFRLRDSDGDGAADVRESLHTGFGVRFAFRGHDMHGLIVGPDGRLYFSIGDRGYNVSDEIKDPASGAVFRCELDGTNLEVIATGLRNPQELAFDEYGNLFTGDNNSDSGDKARWVYIVPGSDTGWRMYYQYLEDRGPFNRERIWEPYDPATTPAYIVPPITNLSDGPSGLAYYPGTGFGDQFAGRFFLCDFRGNATVSGIRTFKNEADGAFFKVVDMEQTFWKMLATDLDFGPDGKLYVSDWVFGWDGLGKGRIYSFHDPKLVDSPILKQTQMLLAGGLQKLKTDQLIQLLGHPDRRVRQEAQFKLVELKETEQLFEVAKSDERQLARLHAIWGIGQSHRQSNFEITKPHIEILTDLFNAEDPEIRAQVAKLAGDSNLSELNAQTSKLLEDANLRVQHFAALAIGKIGNDKLAFDLLCNMIAANDNKDPIIRHSGIMGMVGLVDRNIISKESLASANKADSPAVRLAAVVALRKLNATELSDFLEDPSLQVRLEAVRAIHDLPLDVCMPNVAAMIDQENLTDDAMVRRIINANVRLGTQESARSLAKFAANPNTSEAHCLTALKMLANWAAPQPRDPVLGDWRPLPERDVKMARDALAAHFADIVKGNEKIVAAALSTAGAVNLTSAGQSLEAIAIDSSRKDKTRSAAISSLERIGYTRLAEVIEKLQSDFENLPPYSTGSFLNVLAKLDSTKATKLIAETLERDDILKSQLAIQTLGQMKSEDSAELLSQLGNAIANTEYVPQLRLDVLNALQKRAEEVLKSKAANYLTAIESKEDKLAKYQDTLWGGNAARGKKIFSGKTEVSCIRCHKINAVGGEVGPDLSKIALDRDRKYLLESIVAPNQTIAEGYAQMVVATEDGLTHTGIVKEETEDMLRLMDSDGKLITLSQDEIEDSRMGLSSMPVDLVDNLSLTEIRDLIEYLANRKKYEDDRVNQVEGGHE